MNVPQQRNKFLCRLPRGRVTYRDHSSVVRLSVCLSVRPSRFFVTFLDNFCYIEDNLIQLHTLVHHDQGYILSRGHNSGMYFDKIIPLFGLRKS